jgi:lysozyme family protein
MSAANWKTVYLFVRKEVASGDLTRGISQDQYAAWCEANGSPIGDVKLASEPTIEQIYFAEYWLPWGQMLPSGIDVLYFNAAVFLGGPVHAIALLQQAVGSSDVSGFLGLVTLAAVMKADRTALIGKYTSKLVADHPEWTEKIVELQGIALGIV